MSKKQANMAKVDEVDKDYHDSLKFWNDDASNPINREVDDAVQEYHRTHKPNSAFANLFAVVGFLGNTAIDVATLPFNGKFGDWIDATRKFVGYISSSGVDKELAAAFFDVGAVQNLLIIARAQATRNDVGYARSRRAITSLAEFPEGVDERKFKDVLAHAAR